MAEVLAIKITVSKLVGDMKQEIQELKQIWTTDGWGQPRTLVSKVALVFYIMFVGIFMLSAMAWYSMLNMFGVKK